MPSVLLGSVIDPSPQPIGDGTSIHQAWKAQALTDQGVLTVVFKRLPPDEIAAECLCAAIGRMLGLPIPKPVLLRLTDGESAFGLAHIEGRDLRHFLAQDSDAAIKALLGWDGLNHAAIFDEFIANWDRHVGNLIHDGVGFWLIDHGHALNRHERNRNILAQDVIEKVLRDVGVQRLLNEAARAELGYDALDLDKAADHARIPASLRDDMLDFLESRRRVERLLRERLGRRLLL